LIISTSWRTLRANWINSIEIRIANTIISIKNLILLTNWLTSSALWIKCCS
jgi:hypothetical protein